MRVRSHAVACRSSAINAGGICIGTDFPPGLPSRLPISRIANIAIRGNASGLSRLMHSQQAASKATLQMCSFNANLSLKSQTASARLHMLLLPVAYTAL